MCGVYYLFDGAAVLYVGASTNIEKRIKQHVADRQIDFAGYFVDTCKPEELGELECAALKEFNPPFNTLLSSGLWP